MKPNSGRYRETVEGQPDPQERDAVTIGLFINPSVVPATKKEGAAPTALQPQLRVRRPGRRAVARGRQGRGRSRGVFRKGKSCSAERRAANQARADGTLSVDRGAPAALARRPRTRRPADAAQRLRGGSPAWDASRRGDARRQGVAIRDLAVSRTGGSTRPRKRRHACSTGRRRAWGRGRRRARSRGRAGRAGPDQTLVVVADAGPSPPRCRCSRRGSVRVAGTSTCTRPRRCASQAETRRRRERRPVRGVVVGIQVCDRRARDGIIASPPPGRPDGLAFGGPDATSCSSSVAGRLFRRKTRARGVFAFEAPVKPNPPRL